MKQEWAHTWPGLSLSCCMCPLIFVLNGFNHAVSGQRGPAPLFRGHQSFILIRIHRPLRIITDYWQANGRMKETHAHVSHEASETYLHFKRSETCSQTLFKRCYLTHFGIIRNSNQLWRLWQELNGTSNYSIKTSWDGLNTLKCKTLASAFKNAYLKYQPECVCNRVTVSKVNNQAFTIHLIFRDCYIYTMVVGEGGICDVISPLERWPTPQRCSKNKKQQSGFYGGEVIKTTWCFWIDPRGWMIPRVCRAEIKHELASLCPNSWTVKRVFVPLALKQPHAPWEGWSVPSVMEEDQDLGQGAKAA